MIGCSQKDEFDKGAESGNFSVQLPVPHPFRHHENGPAASGENEIQRRLRCVEEIGGEKNGGAYLVQASDRDGENNDGKRSVADPSLAWFGCRRAAVIFSHMGFLSVMAGIGRGR